MHQMFNRDFSLEDRIPGGFHFLCSLFLIMFEYFSQLLCTGYEKDLYALCMKKIFLKVLIKYSQWFTG